MARRLVCEVSVELSLVSCGDWMNCSAVVHIGC